MKYKIITPPAAEPVTLDMAKKHCRVEHNLEDDLIQAYIIAAREQAEHRTGRAFVEQTLELALDSFPANAIELPLSPAIDVLSVKYIDLESNEITISDSNYVLDNYGLRNFLVPKINYAWPQALKMPNSVKIQYNAGFGNAAAVPQTVKSWILMAVGAFYEHRELIAHNQTYELPDDFCKALLNPVKVRRV